MAIIRVVGGLLGLLIPTNGLSQGDVLSHVLLSGIEAYRTGGAPAAVNAWLTKSPIGRDSELISNTVASLRKVENAYGVFVGYDLVGTSHIGSRVVRSYLVLNYRRGPLFAYFDTYSGADGVVVVGFLFNPKPDPIFPPRLLGG